jgi:hypothetical protein
MPAGKPAPPRPRSPDESTVFNRGVRANGPRFRKAEPSLASVIIVERGRPGLASPRESQARLTGEERMFGNRTN